MKKKNLKKALICALAVPTMLMATGCKEKTETISIGEYTNLVYEAGSNYLRNHSDYKTYGDMTVNSQKTDKEVGKQKVQYKANAEATELSEKEVTITATSTKSQVIEINRDETENGDIAIKVTQTQVSEEKGERPNSDTQLLENYEEKINATVVYTFVKTGEDYKLFKHTKRVVKETGEDDVEVELKEVKTYASQALFQADVESVLEEVDDDLVRSLLQSSEELMFLNPDIYKQGEDKFGLTLKYSNVGLEGDSMIKSEIEQKLEYKDNLPCAVTITNNSVSMDGETFESSRGVTLNYSASAIAAPSDSADYTANESISTNNVVEGMSY